MPNPELHSDWGWPFNKIPRRLTTYKWRPTIKLFGNADTYPIEYEGKTYKYPKPIPNQGQWWVGLGLWYIPCFAWRTKGRWYSRAPVRFDDLTKEHEIPSVTIKRYK